MGETDVYKGLLEQTTERLAQDGPLCKGCWAAPCMCEARGAGHHEYMKKVVRMMSGEEAPDLHFGSFRIMLQAYRELLHELKYLYKNNCGIHDGSRMIYSAGDTKPDFEGAEDLLIQYGLLALDNGQVIDIKEPS